MNTPAYQVEAIGTPLVDTYTGDYARAAASGTFERWKAEGQHIRWTKGYVDSVAQEYTATHLVAVYPEKPYIC